ncbi:MAG: TVP38/TMEM64 family protein [Candidatus Omnitrophota bacterium]|nr:MAG: TVP38/TMEM64 family protein [Candidatus Omnitrophota bacterium]
MKNYKSLLLKLILGLLIIAGIWWLVKCQCVNLESLTPASIRDYIQSFGNLAALVYVIAYTLNTISVFPPIAALSLTAGLAFGALWGAVLLMLSAMLGTSATFIISRLFGRQLIEKMLRGKFRRLDEKLEKNGFMTVLFFRVVPLIPYEVLNYVSGLSKIKFRDYFFATLLGLIPGVVIAAFFGGSLGQIRIFRDIFAPKFLVAGSLMVLILAVPFIYQHMKKKK